jgi:hypothetical protein
VVGAYITAAYWFTASTSFANPAVITARSLSDTFAGICLADVPLFIVAQVAGRIAATSLQLSAREIIVRHEAKLRRQPLHEKRLLDIGGGIAFRDVTTKDGNIAEPGSLDWVLLRRGPTTCFLILRVDGAWNASGGVRTRVSRVDGASPGVPVYLH